MPLEQLDLEFIGHRQSHLGDIHNNYKIMKNSIHAMYTKRYAHLSSVEQEMLRCLLPSTREGEDVGVATFPPPTTSSIRTGWAAPAAKRRTPWRDRDKETSIEEAISSWLQTASNKISLPYHWVRHYHGLTSDLPGRRRRESTCASIVEPPILSS